MDLQWLIGTVHIDALFFVAYARNTKCGWQLHGKVEITLLDGGHAFCAVLQKDIGPDDAFAVIGIANETREMCLLGSHKERCHETNHQKQSFHGASDFGVDEYGVASHRCNGGKHTATVFHIAVEINRCDDTKEKVGIGIGLLICFLTLAVMVA